MNELIDRYHYLGYAPLPGAQLRYFVREGRELLALLGFSAAAWAVAPRDRFIGWENSVRKERLRFVVNNSRFLILPWIHSKCLASRVLATATRRLSDDWWKRYNYRPALVETFVEKDRFAGTSYKAANWICVGETKGRGKLDRKHEKPVPVKTVWLLSPGKEFPQPTDRMNKVKNEETIELNLKQVKELMARLEKQSLEDADYGTLNKMIENLLFLKQAYEDKNISIKRLLRLLFGPSTESARNIMGASDASKKRKSPSANGKRRKRRKRKVMAETA